MPRMGYRETLQWLLDNDDTEWLGGTGYGGEVVASVTAVLVADIFGKTVEQVTADLQKRQAAGDGMAEFQAATVQISGGNYAEAARLLRQAEAKSAGELKAEIAGLRRQCEAKAGA